MTSIKWQSSSRALERIGLYGQFNVGKTKAMLDVMELCAGDMWVIETDRSMMEMLEARPNLLVVEEWDCGQPVTEYVDESGWIHWLKVDDWESFVWAMDYVWARAQRPDWIMIDTVAKTWEWVQEWYVRSVYQMGMDELILTLRSKQLDDGKGSHQVAEGMITDWIPINSQFSPNVRKRMLNSPCHLLVTANEKKLSSRQTDSAVKNMFKSEGFMPTGQKDLVHDVRTVLRFEVNSRLGNSTYSITTLKDRERERWRDVEWGNFVKTYLKANGWKPGKVEQ